MFRRLALFEFCCLYGKERLTLAGFDNYLAGWGWDLLFGRSCEVSIFVGRFLPVVSW